MAITTDLEEKIRRFIKQQGLTDGARLPSERRLAAEWGVSYSTLNRAVLRLLAAGVLRRRGYSLLVCDRAREAKVRRTVHIFCRHRRESEWAAQALQSVGYDARTFSERRLEFIRKELVQIRDHGGTAGILHTHSDQLDILIELHAGGLPVVTTLPCADLSHVSCGYRAIGERTVRHLHDLGHRELVFVREEFPDTYRHLRTREIQSGYRQACMELELARSRKRDNLACLPESESVAAVVKQIPKRVTGIIAETSRIALPLLDALRKSGRRVPADLSLCLCEESPENIGTQQFSFCRKQRLSRGGLSGLVD